MKLLKYQEDSVDKLFKESVDIIEKSKKGTVILCAPPGSGKTTITLNLMERLCAEGNCELFFFWISINSLHIQSMNAAKAHFAENSIITCVDKSDVDKRINSNTAFFVNWDSINKKDNTLILGTETRKSLGEIIETLRARDMKIFMIVDESHKNLDTQISESLIADISPDVSMHISATPKRIENVNCTQKIDIEDVISERLVKSKIFVNREIDKIGHNDDLLRYAINKRNTLKSFYARENYDINPLLLIQLPRRNQKGNSDEILNSLVNRLDKEGINVTNRKLAVKLSETETSNFSDIAQANSNVDVLIFKEALVEGWDCPRASVLLVLREWVKENKTFNMQTIGRIMRTVTRNSYKNKELDYGHIYTAADNFEITKEITDNYVINKSYFTRLGNYKNIQIQSVTKKLIEDADPKNLPDNFGEKIIEKCDVDFKKINVKLSEGSYEKTIKSGESASDSGGFKFSGKNSKKIPVSRDEITESYTAWIRAIASPYNCYEFENMFKECVLQLFKKSNVALQCEDDLAFIFFNEDNKALMEKLFENVKKEFKKADFELYKYEWGAWEVPEIISINNKNREKVKYDKSVMSFDYNDVNKNIPERKFMGKIDSCENVKWWFRNGDKNRIGDNTYFSMLYGNNGSQNLFYPDFIVKTHDALLIIEVKKGQGIAKDQNMAKLKYAKRYCENENKRDVADRLYFWMIDVDRDLESLVAHIGDNKIDEFNSEFENIISQPAVKQGH